MLLKLASLKGESSPFKTLEKLRISVLYKGAVDTELKEFIILASVIDFEGSSSIFALLLRFIKYFIIVLIFINKLI